MSEGSRASYSVSGPNGDILEVWCLVWSDHPFQRSEKNHTGRRAFRKHLPLFRAGLAGKDHARTQEAVFYYYYSIITVILNLNHLFANLAMCVCEQMVCVNV